MNVKLLSPKDISERAGLPYGKALKLIKELNHVQIDNLYYVAEDVFYDFIHPETPIKVSLEQEDNQSC